MKGVYRIDLTPLPESKRWRRLSADAEIIQKRWHLFVVTCQSLHRDGLEYEVQFNLKGSRPNIVIKAHGTAKPRKQASAPSILPQPKTAAYCKQRADEARYFVEGRHKAEKFGPPKYFRNRFDRYRELSGMAKEARQFIQAEYEYWREMEVLSGRRNRFAPGCDEQSHYADEGVAA